MSRELYNQVSIEEAEAEVVDPNQVRRETPPTEYTEEEGLAAFVALLQWLLRDEKLTTRDIAGRALAMAWAINPDLIGNRSLTQIERELRHSVTKQRLSDLVREFSSAFAFRRVLHRQGDSAAGIAPPLPR